jgi:hypothetical protein
MTGVPAPIGYATALAQEWRSHVSSRYLAMAGDLIFAASAKRRYARAGRCFDLTSAIN